MFAGAGETITVLEAVTPVADTVCSLEDHQAEVRVTVIVVLHPVGACHVGVQLTFVNTSPLFHPLGTSFTVTAHTLEFTLVTQVELVRYQASLLKSDTFVGTVGIAHQSTNVLLFAHQVTRFH
jgi:hypothetical protein